MAERHVGHHVLRFGADDVRTGVLPFLFFSNFFSVTRTAPFRYPTRSRGPLYLLTRGWFGWRLRSLRLKFLCVKFPLGCRRE